MNKGKIEIKDRFILEALRSTGYDAYSAIYELIDNSIDAKSTIINISYDKNCLSIKDNGIGMSHDKLNESMNIGCDRTYSSNEIGYFGVGMKSSCLNLIESDVDGRIEITTNNGYNSTKVIWDPFISPLDYDISDIDSLNNNSGTTIKIINVKKFSEQILKKNLGVIFYPTLKNEIIKIYVNDVLIEFNDPLYRDNTLTMNNFVEATVAKTKVFINCCLIDPSTEKHSWDTNSQEGSWSYSKGGLYIIYGGRYIDYGGTMGVKKSDPWDSRTRIEIFLPKELTEEFQLKFNKTNGINLNASDGLNDVVRKTLDMFNWAKNVRQKNGEKTSTEEEVKELESITDNLNDAAGSAGLKSPESDSEIRAYEGEGRGKDKKPRQKKAEIEVKKIFEVRTENLGATNCFWSLGYEKNIFIITLNESHIFYRDIYRNMESGSRKNIIYLLASMGYAQHGIMLNDSNINEEFFWENYWSEVSMKLKHLVSLSK